jgi:hypothetical protein
MKEAKFKIGDLVETNWIGVGKVSDIMYSTVRDQYTYEVCNEDGASDLFTEDCLKAVPKKKDYSMDIKIDIASNVVIATLYESAGGVQTPIRKGHGHLIHDGAVGIAQAASYACMRLYKSMGGNLNG